MDIFKIVKACEIFSSLDDTAITELSKKFTVISLPKNEILFRRGERADDIYILARGRIAIFLPVGKHTEKLVREIEAGESFGEIGAVSHEPRAATARALEKCKLLKLSCHEFSEVCNKYPAVILATMNVIVQRSRALAELVSAKRINKKHIVLIPANKKTSLQAFADKLKEKLQNVKEVAILTDLEAGFYEKYPTVAALKKYISTLEEKHEKIIYILELKKSPLLKLSLNKTDMLFVVATNPAKPCLNSRVIKLVHDEALIYKALPELILLYEKEQSLPKNTQKWLKLAKFGIQHHLRLNKEEDWNRVIRFMRSNAVGIVLGGGGVRSWAHIGALRALEELDIPVDAIGGTSGGSIVAGYYAMNETYKDTHSGLRELAEVTSKTIHFSNVTWPAVSLFSSKTYTTKLKKIFRKVRIENLWLPFFCVTCGFTKSNAVIHRKGLLWKKIRGSTAVPGIYPPLVINGQMHLDGGIVNNLPVDLMLKFSAGIGTIIAVELIHKNKIEHRYKFPPILTFWQTVLAKLKLAHKDYRFPQFVETFLQALLAGSTVKQNENACLADVLVSPDLSNYSLLSVTTSEENELIELGYNATLKAIKAWRRHNYNEQ